MLVKHIAACIGCPSIYLQPFTSCSEILVGNCNFFLPPCINAPVGGVILPLEFREKFGPQETRIMGLPCNVIKYNLFDRLEVDNVFVKTLQP